MTMRSEIRSILAQQRVHRVNSPCAGIRVRVSCTCARARLHLGAVCYVQDIRGEGCNGRVVVDERAWDGPNERRVRHLRLVERVQDRVSDPYCLQANQKTSISLSILIMPQDS